MPDLSQQLVEELRLKLQKNLFRQGRNLDIEYKAAGGSAAVFKVTIDGVVRAYKVFDPKLISGEVDSADNRRLKIQQQLIGHDCKYLIQTYSIYKAEDTAFVEMEYTDWPQLSKQLENVPDKQISPLISQLVEAVKFLEVRGIVHRDIKPENIHVSPDFSRLILLDLGVVREFEGDLDSMDTDHNGHRPFLATAQYSSPEYLFRLDPPSEKLWRGLNFYQVGAVLHDLIMKKPLFYESISLGNRWLVAKDVLTRIPSLSRADSQGLHAMKVVAARCLIKDLDYRLSMVSWSDFAFEGSIDPLTSLKGVLNKLTARNEIPEAKNVARENFNRDSFCDRVIDELRKELIPICTNVVPFSVVQSREEGCNFIGLDFSPSSSGYKVFVRIRFLWGDGIHYRSSQICLGAKIYVDDLSNTDVDFYAIGECAINVSEEITVKVIVNSISGALEKAIGVMDNECLSIEDLNRQFASIEEGV